MSDSGGGGTRPEKSSSTTEEAGTLATKHLESWMMNGTFNHLYNMRHQLLIGTNHLYLR